MTRVATAAAVRLEHEVTITVPDEAQPAVTRRLIEDNDLPRHDLGAWPEALSLRREDIYSDDGR